MSRRIRMLAATASILIILGIAGHGVLAQPTSAATPSTATMAPSAYQTFVAKLTANLGLTDSTKVDAAIKSTLKQMVDAQFAAGNISAKEQAALKAEIDSSTDPSSLFGLDDITGGDQGQADGGTTGGQGADSANDPQNKDGETADGGNQNGDAQSSGGDNQQGADGEQPAATESASTPTP